MYLYEKVQDTQLDELSHPGPADLPLYRLPLGDPRPHSGFLWSFPIYLYPHWCHHPGRLGWGMWNQGDHGGTNVPVGTLMPLSHYSSREGIWRQQHMEHVVSSSMSWKIRGRHGMGHITSHFSPAVCSKGIRRLKQSESPLFVRETLKVVTLIKENKKLCKKVPCLNQHNSSGDLWALGMVPTLHSHSLGTLPHPRGHHHLCTEPRHKFHFQAEPLQPPTAQAATSA